MREPRVFRESDRVKIGLSVLIYCVAISVAFASEKFDFRGVTPGMKVHEINSLEAVKLGYVPKIDLKDGGFNTREISKKLTEMGYL